MISLLFVATACKKDKDTPSKSAEEYLTAHAWKPNEIRAMQGGSSYYYKRGGTSTAGFNLDNESILFKADGTGTYTGTGGNSVPLTWTFTNTAKTRLTWTANLGSPTTVSWEINTLNDNLLRYDEYYPNTISFGERVPK